MMRKRLLTPAMAAILLAMLFVLGTTSPIQAAVVYLKGRSEPLVGFVEFSDDQSITLRVTTEKGEELHRKFMRSEIDLLLQPVIPSRLASLSPDNPRAYREYAEELVEMKSDPEAVETATRLFIIAAHLSPKTEARSALLGLTPLVKDPQRVRQLRALAYMIDPKHDAKLLQGDSPSAKSGAAVDDKIREDTVSVLQMVRTEHRADAKQQLQREEIRDAIRSGTKQITPEECLEIIQGTCPGCGQGVIPPYMMQKLIAAELELISSKSPTEMPRQWGYFLDESFQKPLPVLTLDKATRFDPAKCIFRDGKWIEPSP
ncbi:hypothetical protein GC197_16755 [bacterium]|nr:hypothetical protein [bacterium]